MYLAKLILFLVLPAITEGYNCSHVALTNALYNNELQGLYLRLDGIHCNNHVSYESYSMDTKNYMYYEAVDGRQGWGVSIESVCSPVMRIFGEQEVPYPEDVTVQWQETNLVTWMPNPHINVTCSEPPCPYVTISGISDNSLNGVFIMASKATEQACNNRPVYLKSDDTSNTLYLSFVQHGWGWTMSFDPCLTDNPLVYAPDVAIFPYEVNQPWQERINKEWHVNNDIVITCTPFAKPDFCHANGEDCTPSTCSPILQPTRPEYLCHEYLYCLPNGEPNIQFCPPSLPYLNLTATTCTAICTDSDIFCHFLEQCVGTEPAPPLTTTTPRTTTTETVVATQEASTTTSPPSFETQPSSSSTTAAAASHTQTEGHITLTTTTSRPVSSEPPATPRETTTVSTAGLTSTTTAATASHTHTEIHLTSPTTTSRPVSSESPATHMDTTIRPTTEGHLTPTTTSRPASSELPATTRESATTTMRTSAGVTSTTTVAAASSPTQTEGHLTPTTTISRPASSELPATTRESATTTSRTSTGVTSTTTTAAAPHTQTDIQPLTTSITQPQPVTTTTRPETTTKQFTTTAGLNWSCDSPAPCEVNRCYINPYDCGGYMQCTNVQEPSFHNCPAGQYANLYFTNCGDICDNTNYEFACTELASCGLFPTNISYSNETMSCTHVDECREGDRYTASFTCFGYWECIGGEMYYKTCPPNSFYLPSQHSCIYFPSFVCEDPCINGDAEWKEAERQNQAANDVSARKKADENRKRFEWLFP